MIKLGFPKTGDLFSWGKKTLLVLTCTGLHFYIGNKTSL